MTDSLAMGLCYGSLAPTTTPELVALAGNHGFNTIMLPVLPDPGPNAEEPFAAVLERYGIQRVVLDGAMGMLPRCGFATAHGMTAEQHLDVARRFGVTCFNVPHYQGDPETPLVEFVDALGPFCEQAALLGCTVALEFLPGTGMPDLERVVRIIEAVDADNLGMTFDIWHWARLGGSLADIEALPAGIIREFQINDRDADQDQLPDSAQWGRRIPGEGALPLASIVRAVQANAPGLPPNAEVFCHNLQALPPAEAARRIATGLRGVLSALGSSPQTAV